MYIQIGIYAIAISFAVSSVISRYLFRNANKLHVGKRAYSERVRLHKKGIPRLGGLAIYTAFCVTVLLFYFFKKEYFKYYETKLLGVFLASGLIVACGLYDDLVKRLSYKIKFIVQILAIVIVIIFGYRINVITNPFDGKIFIGILGIPLIILWILAVMNSINLIDGLDGLACGVSAIVCLVFIVIGISQQHIFSLLFATAIIGATLGFLRYNFYPAKLFLGDSGSFLLGFMLAILAIESATKRATVVTLIIPLLTLFIPLASVVFTFSRRIAYASNPFRPDRKHLHYRFIQAGVSHRDTVLMYYSVTLVYAAFGIYCFFMPKKYELAIIGIAGATMWVLYMWALHFLTLRERVHRKQVRDKKSG